MQDRYMYLLPGVGDLCSKTFEEFPDFALFSDYSQTVERLPSVEFLLIVGGM